MSYLRNRARKSEKEILEDRYNRLESRIFAVEEALKALGLKDSSWSVAIGRWYFFLSMGSFKLALRISV